MAGVPPFAKMNEDKGTSQPQTPGLVLEQDEENQQDGTVRCDLGQNDPGIRSGICPERNDDAVQSNDEQGNSAKALNEDGARSLNSPAAGACDIREPLRACREDSGVFVGNASHNDSLGEDAEQPVVQNQELNYEDDLSAVQDDADQRNLVATMNHLARRCEEGQIEQNDYRRTIRFLAEMVEQLNNGAMGQREGRPDFEAGGDNGAQGDGRGGGWRGEKGHCCCYRNRAFDDEMDIDESMMFKDKQGRVMRPKFKGGVEESEVDFIKRVGHNLSMRKSRAEKKAKHQLTKAKVAQIKKNRLTSKMIKHGDAQADRSAKRGRAEAALEPAEEDVDAADSDQEQDDHDVDDDPPYDDEDAQSDEDEPLLGEYRRITTRGSFSIQVFDQVLKSRKSKQKSNEVEYQVRNISKEYEPTVWILRAEIWNDEGHQLVQRFHEQNPRKPNSGDAAEKAISGAPSNSTRKNAREFAPRVQDANVVSSQARTSGVVDLSEEDGEGDMEYPDESGSSNSEKSALGSESESDSGESRPITIKPIAKDAEAASNARSKTTAIRRNSRRSRNRATPEGRETRAKTASSKKRPSRESQEGPNKKSMK